VLAVVFGRFPGVLILVPGRFLKRFLPGFSFLDFLFLDIASRGAAGKGAAGKGVASSGTGGFRLTRLTVAPPASYGWLGILRGVSWEGLCGRSVLEVRIYF
jgi:hypothetical protein